MKNLKKDLQAINRELAALIKKVEKISVAVGKVGKPKAAKKTVAKKTVAKKSAKRGAARIVLGLIERSGKRIDAAELIKETGFDRHKLHNIIFRLKKQGKVKMAAKGVYVKA